MLKAVLFDWDGTLVDSKSAILTSYREATSRILGQEFPVTPADVAFVIPMRAQESFGMMSDDPEVVEGLIAAYHRAYLSNSATQSGAYPGAAQTLSTLHAQGYRIGIITSKGRERVDQDAERFGLGEHIEHFVTGDVSAERKPHPGPVLEALAHMRLDPSEVVYVGDGQQDVIAGKGAGVITVAAIYGFHGEEALAEGPDHVVRGIDEVVAIVRTVADQHSPTA